MADRELRYEVGVDGDQAVRDAQQVGRRIDDELGEPIEVPVEVESSDWERELARFDRITDELRAKGIDVPLRVDPSSVDDVKRTADKVGEGGSEAGKRFGSTFIRDVGSTFNEQGAGVVGDLSEGILTAGEAVGGKFADLLAGPVGAALGIGGIAFVAAQKFWQMWNQGAEDAKKRTEAAKEAAVSLASGDYAAAADKIIAGIGEAAFKTGEALGFTTDAMVDFIQGTKGAPDVLRAVQDRLAALRPEEEKYQEQVRLGVAGADDRYKALVQERTALDALSGSLGQQQQAYADANAELLVTQRRQFDVMKATNATSDALLAQAARSLPAVRNEILLYTASLNGIPDAVISQILADTNPEDVQQLQAEIAKVKDKQVDVTANTAQARAELQKLAAQAQALVGVFAGSGIGVGVSGRSAAPAGVTNVTINAGLGSDAFALQRGVEQANRRLGRLSGVR